MSNTAIFFRDGLFYPIDLLSPEECGKSLATQAAEHAELNPGTTKVESVDGAVLWSNPAPVAQSTL
jgi:hypothetical protein